MKEEPSLPPDYVSLAQLQERWLQKQQEKKKLKEKQQEIEEKKQREANENKNEKGVNNTTALPPDYVSLAQLQERWLQNQEEKKKLKEKQQEIEEKKQSEQNEKRNQKGVNTATNGHGKMEGGSIRDVTHRKIYGREMGAIEEKGKGKEIVISGFRNGEKKKKMIEIKQYNEGFDVCKGVEIISRNDVNMGIAGDLSGENSEEGRNSGEIRGIEESISVSMVEVLPRNVKGMGYTGGLRRNGDNRGSVYKGKREYIVKQHHTEVSLGYDKKLTEKRVNGDNLDKDYSVNESNEVDLKSEGETLEVANETDGAKGRYRNGLMAQRRNSRNKIKENSYGKFGNRREMEQRDSNGMVWVKKEEK